MWDAMEEGPPPQTRGGLLSTKFRLKNLANECAKVTRCGGDQTLCQRGAERKLHTRDLTSSSFVFLFSNTTILLLLGITTEAARPCVSHWTSVPNRRTNATRVSEEPLLLTTETTWESTREPHGASSTSPLSIEHTETTVLCITLGRQSPYYSGRPPER